MCLYTRSKLSESEAESDVVHIPFSKSPPCSGSLQGQVFAQTHSRSEAKGGGVRQPNTGRLRRARSSVAELDTITQLHAPLVSRQPQRQSKSPNLQTVISRISSPLPSRHTAERRPPWRTALLSPSCWLLFGSTPDKATRRPVRCLPVRIIFITRAQKSNSA